MNLDSPQQIRSILEHLGVRLKKRWGQNFMINAGARRKIITLLEPAGHDTVWEIGAGLGSLTGDLVTVVKKLVAFEVDRGLIAFLEAEYSKYSNFSLMSGDVLKTWRKARIEHGQPDKVIGNLPYRSASAIIGDFIQENFQAGRLVFTVQKELADRMTARPGNKNYSSFSVLCQFAYQIKDEGDLKSGSFFPPPDVSSTIITLTPRQDLPRPTDRALFLDLLRGLFAFRRKTLRNNLAAFSRTLGLDWEALVQAAARALIDLDGRAEELDVKDFIRLADEIVKSSRD